jgi:hypothetical protein
MVDRRRKLTFSVIRVEDGDVSGTTAESVMLNPARVAADLLGLRTPTQRGDWL